MLNLVRPRPLLVLALLSAVAWSALPPAASVAEGDVLAGYPVHDADWQTLVGYLRGRFEQTGAKIAYDPRTRQVLVVASPALQKEIAREIQARTGAVQAPRLEGPTGAGGEAAAVAVRPAARLTISTYALKNASPREFENSLREIWGTRLGVRYDEKRSFLHMPGAGSEGDGRDSYLQLDHQTGEIVFQGNADSRAAFEKILPLLDVKDRQADGAARVVALANADPVQVRQAVYQLQTSLLAGKEAATAVARRSTETVRRLSASRMLARMFQQQPAAGEQPPGASQPGAQQPEGAQPGGEQPQPGAVQAPAGQAPAPLGQVRVEIVGDVIVITGPQRDVERVKQMIEEIDRLSQETRPVVYIHELKHTNSETLGQLVNQIYTDVLLARLGTVSITPLVKPNALLLIGRQENIDAVLELVAKLDVPVAPSLDFRVFRLRHMAATDAEQAIRAFFSRTPAGQQAQVTPGQQVGSEVLVGLPTRLTIVAEYRSNSLIVQAGPRDMQEIAALLGQLDVESAAAINEVRVFRLKNTLAQELATILQSAIRGGAAPTVGVPQQQAVPGVPGQVTPQQPTTQGQQTQRSTTLQFLTVDAQGRRYIQSVIPSDLTVAADVPANALIVRGPREGMELIEALIKELDQVPAAESQIKVFTVINGDATNMTAMLQQLFGQQVTAGRGTGGLFGGGAQPALNIALQTGGPAAGESTLVPLRFAVDARTNSIIASGSAGDLLVVEALLIRLDEGNIPSRKLLVYRLKNAFADDVANSITTLLLNQRQIIQQNLLFNQAIGPFEQLEREIIVVSEPQTNSVIVSATPKFVEDILRIIRELDYRPPMVMVQVIIAEIALTDLSEFGIELGLQDSLLFDRGKAALATTFPQSDPGFGFNGNGLPNVNSFDQETLAGQALSTFGLGRSNAALGYGGVVLSAANESISILIRALENQGKVQILSRPQVMAIHNRQARILVGERVARITSSSINQQGNVQNSVEDVDVGLILNIIPQINDDGVIIMNIQAERSALGPESEGTQIATTPDGAPIRQANIRNTSAVTTISAKDGQTVVFAGLISRDKEAVRRGVPYLSDLPLLGPLFEFTTDRHARRELLIVMTPYIVKDDIDYQWINDVESERMTWCLADVVSVHGDVGLRGGTGMFCDEYNVPVIYPDEDPTGSGCVVAPRGMDREFVVPGSEREIVPAPGNEPPPAGPSPSPPSRYGVPRDGGTGLEPIPDPHAGRIRRPQDRTIQPTGGYSSPSGGNAATYPWRP